MAKTVPKPTENYKSAEIVSDSDSSASSSSASRSTKRKLNGKGVDGASKKTKLDPAPTNSNSESSEDDSEQSSEADGQNTPKTTGKSTVGHEQSRSSSGSSEEESDDSSSSSESSDSESEGSRGPEDEPRMGGSSQSEPARLPFVPPAGFSKIMNTPKTPQSASLFDAASLQGKELWYMTAPATVPIAELQRISSEHIKSGAPALSHNSKNYKLAISTNPDKVRVLVPRRQGEYDQIKSEVTQYLNLSQILSIPDSALFPLDRQPEQEEQEVNVHNVRPARQQPEGLRTRWWPTGFEDNESLAQSAAATAEQAKKKKKHKHKQHADEQAEQGVITNGHGPELEPGKTKKSNKKHKDAGRDDVRLQQNDTDEKKRRKKNKKADVDVDMAEF